MGRKTVTILLCSIFLLESLIPKFELSDISNLPALWSHYQMHKALSPGITFLSFLHLHYDADSKHAEQDPLHHQKLPFSKHQHTQTFQFLSNDLPSICVRYRFLRVIEDVFYCEQNTLHLTNAVWQPPRM